MIKRVNKNTSRRAVITFPHKVMNEWEAVTIVHSLSGKFSPLQNLESGDRDVREMVGKTIIAAGETLGYSVKSETSRGFNTEKTGKFHYRTADGMEHEFYG